MATYALLKDNGTRVANLIEWDGVTVLSLPPHLAVVPYDRSIHPDLGLDIPVGPGWQALIPAPAEPLEASQ